MRHEHDRGAAAVEVAILSVFLVLLVVGIVDVGRAIFTRIAIEDAAQAGAAYGALVETAGVNDIIDRAVESIDNPDLTNHAIDPDITITVTCLEDTSGSNRTQRFIRVEVQYNQDLITPVASIFTGPIRLRAAATSERFYDHPTSCTPIPIP